MTMAEVYLTADYKALLAGIKAAPGEDLPRLVMADYLDDCGQAERAEFVRVQCRIHETKDRVMHRLFGGGKIPDPLVVEHAGLRRREEELLFTWAADWWPLLSGFAWTTGPTSSMTGFGVRSATSAAPASWFHRGFIHTLTLPADAWVRYGDDLLAREPVAEVRLTTVPAVYESADGMECRFIDDPTEAECTRAECWAASPDGEGRPLLGMLRLRWPGVTFTLLSPEAMWRQPGRTPSLAGVARRPMVAGELVYARDFYAVRPEDDRLVGTVVASALPGEMAMVLAPDGGRSAYASTVAELSRFDQSVGRTQRPVPDEHSVYAEAVDEFDRGTT